MTLDDNLLSDFESETVKKRILYERGSINGPTEV